MLFTATVKNDPQQGVIRIECISTTDNIENITKVRIKRKIFGSISFTTIKEINIDNASDFTFTVTDNECRSGLKYDYQIIPVTDLNVEMVGESLTVLSRFNGIYISDDTSEWMCELNPDYDYGVNTAVAYVKPLKGKYPIRVSNGDTCYSSGHVQGLFLPKDTNGCYADIDSILSAARAYKDSLLNFLCNGETKLLKTYDGHIWRVGIDANPKEIPSKFPGTSEIKFSWTEIDDPPAV